MDIERPVNFFVKSFFPELKNEFRAIILMLKAIFHPEFRNFFQIEILNSEIGSTWCLSIEKKEKKNDFNFIFSFSAVIDLNGRFFGGRQVSAGFYNLDRFRRLDLGG